MKLDKNERIDILIIIISICVCITAISFNTPKEFKKVKAELVNQQLTTITLRDSITYYKILNNAQADSIISLTGNLYKEQQSRIDTNTKYEELIAERDSLKAESFLYKYKVERIKYYDKIVESNSSQSIYFRGWVRRVIYE